jgi:hypothetical protein
MKSSTTVGVANDSPILRKTSDTSSSRKSTGPQFSPPSQSSANAANELSSKIQRSCEWLTTLNELHYFPYNSCNALTIYSYAYWPAHHSFLISTKENNVKEMAFRTIEQLGRNGQTELDEDETGGLRLVNDLASSSLEPSFKIHKLSKVTSLLNASFWKYSYRIKIKFYFGSRRSPHFVNWYCRCWEFQCSGCYICVGNLLKLDKM